MLESMLMNKNKIYIKSLNILGTLENIISVLTYRGFDINELRYVATKDTKFTDTMITFNCTDSELGKIVKILYNLINVIEVNLVLTEIK